MATANSRTVPAGIVEVEVFGENGSQHFFRPMGRSLRGRVDFHAMRGGTSKQLESKWPDAIPGVIIGIDFERAEKYIREPLHDDEHQNIRQQVTSRNYRLPPARETFAGETLATWVHWLHRGVKSGHLRVIKGTLPPVDAFPDKPRLSFISSETKGEGSQLANSIAKMADAVSENTKVLRELLTQLMSK